MNVGPVGSLPIALSSSAALDNPVQTVAAITVLKKAETADADIARLLIASATGIGQRLDVKA